MITRQMPQQAATASLFMSESQCSKKYLVRHIQLLLSLDIRVVMELVANFYNITDASCILQCTREDLLYCNPIHPVSSPVITYTLLG